MIEMPNRPLWVYCRNCYSTTHTENQCPYLEDE